MSNSSGDKLCPICDSPLQPGSKKCGFCGTDLSIFDMDVEEPVEQPVQPKPSVPAPKKSIDAMVREVISSPPEIKEQPEPVSDEEVPVDMPEESASTAASLFSQPTTVEVEPEVEEAAPPEEEKPEGKEVSPAGEEYFECPECGSRVGVSSTSCPGCGAIFADEGTEVFQCPACNTLVNVDAKTCPGCGAMFVESEEEAVEEVAQPVASAQPEIEPPVAEVPVVSEPAIVREEATPEAEEEEPQVSEEPSMEPAKEKKSRSPFGWLKKLKKDEPKEDLSEEPEMESQPEPEPVEIPPVRHVREEPKPRIPEPEFTKPAQMPKATPAAKAVSKDKGKELARMVAEMKPLLSLAMQNEIEIGESKQLIDDAAAAGRDRQLEKALDLVNTARASLMDKIDVKLAETLDQLKEEVDVAKELGGEVSRSMTYIAEIEKARTSGDVEAAFIYSDKVSNELLPITGRYNESKKKISALKSLLADCEMLILDTREARVSLVEASKAFNARDFDKAEMLVKQANERLNRDIPERLTEEIKNARHMLVDAKVKNVNITPMLTVLKSVTNLTKSKNYPQALKELRDFKEMAKKAM